MRLIEQTNKQVTMISSKFKDMNAIAVNMPRVGSGFRSILLIIDS